MVRTAVGAVRGTIFEFASRTDLERIIFGRFSEFSQKAGVSAGLLLLNPEIGWVLQVFDETGAGNAADR